VLARLLRAAYGFGLLFWLSTENRSVQVAALLGLAGSWLWLGRPQKTLPAKIVIGALVGGGAALWATLLMFFKTALHAHPVADYPLPLLLAMLARIPVWALAGGLFALSLGLLAPVEQSPNAEGEPANANHKREQRTADSGQ
jgi:hypothetical protein